MKLFPDFLRTRRAALLVLLAVVALAAAAWGWRAFWEPPDPLLTTPKLALESLQSGTLYFNGTARSWLLALRPDLLADEDRDPASQRVREMSQAALNPKLFRQLDRQYRFDAVLLMGDPSQYKPLLDHLVETKDWKLRYADHTSLIFRRDGGQPWELADFEAVRKRLSGESPKSQARALAQAATKLIAAGRLDAGRSVLDDASHLAPNNPEVANGLALYHMGRAEWREAAAQVERALAEDSRFFPALATKTQLLFGTKHFGEAFDVSRRLIAELPEDPNLLFYHAKIAHEAHAYKEEVETLEKLIARAQEQGNPTGGFQLYLGQAYAATGDATRSIDSFMLALNDPDLPDDQRAFARENIARIKKRTGL